mmetsp:Transcript_8079/g.19316  ORF Transcript_8079/g.19316 Transcript_8079/m.19316 type:complete len:403 (-) Transcript_8079:309-1517(-)
MSSYLDTGNVLIENACSIERTAECLSTLCPIIPGLSYFRFNPVDEANNMELDSIDPVEHEKCIKAAERYIDENRLRFEEAATALLAGSEDSGCRVEHEGLGSAKGLIVVECPQARGVSHSRSCHEAIADLSSAQPHFLKRLSLAAPIQEKGSTPDGSPQHPSQNGSLSERRRRSFRVSTSASPEILHLARSIQEYAGQVGVIHLALHQGPKGAVTRWAHKVAAVAEPSEEAADLTVSLGLPQGSTIAEGLAERRTVETEAGTLAILSHQTQDLNGSLVSSYLFRQTFPAQYMTPDDVVASQVIWQGNLIVSSCSLPSEIVGALLEARAKAVLAPNGSISTLPTEDLIAFFEVFYKALYCGHALLRALELAEANMPRLVDVFCLFYLLDGSPARALARQGSTS